MKLVWKLSIPQICIVVCLGIISYIVINSSFISMREMYVTDVVDECFNRITKDIEGKAQESLRQTSVFTRLPAVIDAYKIALSGNIDDPYSPQSQKARDMLRTSLAPMLDSFEEQTGKKLELHFHLPNSRSLVRLWRDKQFSANGEEVDISDDLSTYRATVTDVNRSGKVVMGIELGSGGLAIRGVVPVIAPDGSQLGSAEVLQDFDPILDNVTEIGKIEISLYINGDLLTFIADPMNPIAVAEEIQNPEINPHKGDFVRIKAPQGGSFDDLITPELLSKGKYGRVFEYHGSMALATLPINDYLGKQLGVMVCVMNTDGVSRLANTAAVILALMLTVMVIAPSASLLLQSGILIIMPLNKVRAKIQDIVENRVNLSDRISIKQKDEIGNLVKWFNALTAKVDGMLEELRNADRRTQSLLRVNNDMLSEIRSESAKFEEMAHWYMSILDALPFPVSVQDEETRWKFINAPLEKILGKKRNEVIGMYCYNWGTEICNTKKCCILCARKGLKRIFSSLDDKSYQIDVEILKDLHGDTAGYLEVIQDITKLERVTKQQADAEAASKSKSIFLAKMSHEIRTPMNAIMGITDIQLQNEEIDPGIREAFSQIYDSGDLLLSIINDILDLSKIEAGKMEISPVTYTTAGLINDVVQLNWLRFENKMIDFSVQLDEKIPLVLIGDDIRVKQILNNLLSNAFKYTESGEVSFSVAVEPSAEENGKMVTLVFCVKDTGQGMTADQVKMLFDEYSRFNLEANRVTEGSGLGMNITRNLLQLMNGSISIESEPGKGTTVTVHLPQKKDDAALFCTLGKDLKEKLQNFRVAKLVEKKRVQISRDPMYYGSILVVDDVGSNLYVARGLITPYGLSIETAMSGFEAIERINNGEEYDIIFMDHMMPGMDGIEATKIIRSMGYTKPIVALTANALVGQAEMFLENGFDDFISKPIDLLQLNTLLNKLIRDKQPREVIEAARQRKKELEKQTEAVVSTPKEDTNLFEYFIEDAEKAIATLKVIIANDYRRVNDLQMYIIAVHGMKSALANIGEMDFSAFACKLEQAGREKNINVIAAETPVFLDELQAMIDKLKLSQSRFSAETPIGESDNARSYLFEKLTAIQEACSTFDKKNAEAVLAELNQKTLSPPVQELLTDIARHLSLGEFWDAMVITGDYIKNTI